jgi:ABC-2 type transport system permease protein
MIVMGVADQALRGFATFELGVYAKELLVLDLVAFAFLAILSLLIHVVVNNRFVGYFAFVAFVVVNTFIWGPLKIQTLMVQYGGTPTYVYSDMNGFGPYVAGLLWFNLYWALFAGLLLVVVMLLWIRGTDVDAAVRRFNTSLRFRGSTRWATVGLLVGWLVMGGFVYHNTQVLNEYTPTREAEDRAVRYELGYKADYEGRPAPRVVDLRYEIDVYPHARDLRARGSPSTRSLWDCRSRWRWRWTSPGRPWSGRTRTWACVCIAWIRP